MGVPAEAWEYSLLVKAHEALRTPTSSTHMPTFATRDTCEAAYRYCARLVKFNSPTFYLASALLPRQKRHAVRALYAFCRATDDLIDQMPHTDQVDQAGAARNTQAPRTEQEIALAQSLLEAWQTRLEQSPNAYDPVPLAWADTRARYHIPHGYEAQLIDGIARDLRQQRYSTFAELAEYCYGVASTVGLMVMHIVDFQSEDALPYAVKLGIALQLTNILRDVAVDWQAGRLYLPLDELAQFNLTEADIARGTVDSRWRAFMTYQIARARMLYTEAEPGIALLDAEGRFAIAAAASLYRAILEDIEAHEYDVFHRRAHVGTGGKLRRLPSVWWATRGLTQR